MTNERVKELFRQADTEFNKAQKELYHPSADVVNYSVCVNARSALYRFLQCLSILYADENKETIKESLTLDQLLQFCRKYNKQLKESDFSHVNCIHADVRKENENGIFYCNDTCKVQECTNAAAFVRNLVLENAWENLHSGEK